MLGAILIFFAVGVFTIYVTKIYAEQMILYYRKGDKYMNNIFSPKVYDWCKWISVICLPAISTFIVVISKIWGWADLGNMIAQSITACAVLLGSLLGISHIQYKNNAEDAE